MTEHGPWKTIETVKVHDNPWIRVDHSQVIDPGGNPGEYSTIHFKNLAIGVVPLDKNNNVYLVGQYRYPLKQYSWEIPEGGGALDVLPIETGKRELKEETGISAAHWSELLICHLSNSVSDEKAIIFLARELEFGIPEPEEDEDLVVKKVGLTEFFSLVRNGEITDSLSVMAALKLEVLFLKNEL